MIPAFSIASNGKDYSNTYRQRMVSLKVSEDAGEHSDTFEVELADTDGKVPIPVKGEILTVSLGYRGDLREMGHFIVDEPSLEGPPDIVRLSGKAAPFISTQALKPFQSRKTRSFDNITLGALVQKIAAEAGLIPSIDPNLGAIMLPHIDQTAESSMNLLTRLAHTYNAIMKPKSGKLGFVQYGQGVNPAGQDVGGMIIDRTSCKSYSLKINQRANFDKVRTRSHDTATGSTFLSETTKNGTTTAIEVPQFDTSSSSDAGNGDSGNDATYEHPHDYPDQDTAEQASKSIYNRATMATQTVSVTVLGNAKIVAGGMMKLVGFKKAIMNQSWWISKVEHEYAKTGFVTIISGMLPATTPKAGSNTASVGAKEFASGAGFAADK